MAHLDDFLTKRLFEVALPQGPDAKARAAVIGFLCLSDTAAELDGTEADGVHFGAPVEGKGYDQMTIRHESPLATFSANAFETNIADYSGGRPLRSLVGLGSKPSKPERRMRCAAARL